MSKVVIYGDLHLTDKNDFWYKVSKERVNLIIDSEYNNKDNYLILLGDITDKSIVNSFINNLLLYFFENLKYKKIFIIHGNHTYYWHKERKKHISTLFFLKERFSNIEVIEEKEKVFEIEGIKFLGLPHLKSNMINGQSMKTYYENLPEEISNQDYDFIVGHLADKTNTTFGHYSDISYLKGIPILGHIHKAKGNSLGSIDITNRSEKNKDSYMYVIDYNSDDYNQDQKLPKITNFYDVQYDDPDLNFDAKFPVLDIYSAPSKEEALEKFKDYYVEEVYEKEYNTVLNNSEKDIENKSIKDLFIESTQSIENLDVKNYIMNIGV